MFRLFILLLSFFLFDSDRANSTGYRSISRSCRGHSITPQVGGILFISLRRSSFVDDLVVFS